MNAWEGRCVPVGYWVLSSFVGASNLLTLGSFGWKEMDIADKWWMRIVRRIRGVTIPDRMRSEFILKELKASKLSDLIEERDLTYIDHILRYPRERLTRFVAHAEIPGRGTSGGYKQWTKETSRRLERLQLNTDMMLERKEWRSKL